MPRSDLRLYVCALPLLALACGRTQQPATPVAAPSVTLARSDAAIGMPIEMMYRFVVSPNAPAFSENDVVFVHFLDTDGELMWTDDHQPPVPTTQWKPGQTVEYSRTMFVPKFPYSGETRIQLGIYSPKTGARIPLSGETLGQQAYEVAKFNLHPQTDNLYVVFKDGWHETEVAEEATGVEWQWDEQPAGEDVYAEEGTPFPDRTLESIKRTTVGIKGPAFTRRMMSPKKTPITPITPAMSSQIRPRWIGSAKSWE